MLVVEDEPLVALDLATTLFDSGAYVVGPARTVAAAMKLMDREEIDVAVLDFRLIDETSMPVARRLFLEHTPFLFHTGSRNGPHEAAPGITIIPKPSQPKELVAAVKELMATA